MAYDMLHEISNQKDSWKVKVRIIRLWDAINLNNNELISLDMILLDEEGTMIHGKVMKHMVNKFRPLIQEGLVYMIANFKVMSAMNFRPVESEKVLNFLHTTKIQEIKGQKNIKIAEQIHRISELHPSYMSMQYPLLFPYGEDGFRPEIEYENKRGSKGKRKYVTMLEFYAYRIQQRLNQASTLQMSGRLFLQFLVDAATCIEQWRLNWYRTNQGKLRTELYRGLHDAIENGDTRTEQVGQRLILPSSCNDSPRNKQQNYQDAMAICRWAGYPDLFITFTCNPKWLEIQDMLDLIPGQKPEDRPDIVARVFMLKLKELMNDIKNGKCFGQTIASKFT
ncbi:uncharacterized protein [Aegilops tauschii subsp. strangulata]|uniref:uncharacterized protein n=1 Tax=Aegilops tauschii subsp. strangulata TaxID=200361 RepID=UPI003CC8AFFF